MLKAGFEGRPFSFIYRVIEETQSIAGVRVPVGSFLFHFLNNLAGAIGRVIIGDNNFFW
jgi:hypothetical protein